MKVTSPKNEDDLSQKIKKTTSQDKILSQTGYLSDIHHQGLI